MESCNIWLFRSDFFHLAVLSKIIHLSAWICTSSVSTADNFPLCGYTIFIYTVFIPLFIPYPSLVDG